METFQMGRPGAGSDRLSMEDEELLQRITQRMRRKLIEQRILSKPCFQDFDKWVVTIEAKNRSRFDYHENEMDCDLKERYGHFG